jgi:hypothetical protein
VVQISSLFVERLEGGEKREEGGKERGKGKEEDDDDDERKSKREKRKRKRKTLAS